MLAFRFLAALTIVSTLPVSAAEIKSSHPSRNNEVVLEGKIEAGDFEKFQSFLFANYPLEIYLASPGGDLTEAMKIGRLVRSLKLETVVPGKYPPNFMAAAGFPRMHNLSDLKSNYMCVSSCFFVFVAGVKRFVDSPFGDAILGVHRPYLSESDLQALNSDQAVVSANRTRAIVEIYLREMGVPPKYLDEMFSVSKDNIHWISHDDVNADFSGFIPELRDWVDARCDNRSQAERTIWDQSTGKAPAELTPAKRAIMEKILEKEPERFDCEIKLQRHLSLDAYEQILKTRNKMSTPPTAR